jgi:hypothetical protein
MIFQNRLKNPRALVSVGMSFLVIAIAWPRFFHPTTQFWLDATDGIRGMLSGVAIAINFLAFRLAARQPRCDAN